MNDKIKNVASEIWSDLVKSCKLYTSLFGALGAFVYLVNACKPGTLADITCTSKPQAAKR